MSLFRKSITVAGVAAAVVALASAPAYAAAGGTVSTTAGIDVIFTAARGAANDVVVTHSGRTVTVDDRVALKAGKGCSKVRGDATKVRCTVRADWDLFVADLGDRSDRFVNKSAARLFVEGGTGNDRITGGSNGDYLAGNSGKDVISGRGGNDQVVGGSGADTLYGGAGNDGVGGGTGSDVLKGGAGDDSLGGYTGNDVLYGNSGADRLDGGANGGRGDTCVDSATTARAGCEH
ncbi:hypothetical protein KZ829_03155 [Actinoplanes hulinensis]|uniref:Calcium-binding protein n=1 Tax=Actinoplanes hulinensis TaxID=1144547 RepID=A0ABS7AVF8_9ACTN|nr:calcium-binding protein [Actinoplanes hulinensis]MBW6432738.1 hypothetical protein [Actinoplanes hulinensis]